MRRMRIVVCCLLLCLAAVCAQAEGGFRFDLFESKASLYSRYFDEVDYQDDDLAFITPAQGYKELAFTHEGESPYYYSAIMPDILVIHYGTKDEYALFRIWIEHCTETPALKTHTVTVKAGGKAYAFDVKEDVDEQLYENRTHSETSLLMINEASLGLMELWTAAVDAGSPILMRLEGENGSVEFTVPDGAAQACAITYGAYVDAGGLKSVGSVSGTEVSVAQSGSIRDKGFLIADGTGLNGNTLYLPSADCAVSFPPEYLFEKDINRVDAQDLAPFGFDEQTAQSGLATVGDQYRIYAPEDSVWYSVSVMDAESEPFDAFTPEQERLHLESIKRMFADTPMSVLSGGFVDAPHTKLLKVKSSIRMEDHSLAYAIQYEAIYRGRQVTLTAMSDSGRFSSSMEALCDAVASTLRFGSAARENGTLLSAQTHIDLNDERAGRFSIPALWYVEDREEEQNYVQTSLDPLGEAGGWMTYAYTDFRQVMLDMGLSQRELEEILSEKNADIMYRGFVDGAGYQERIEEGIEKIGDYEYYCIEGFLENSYAGMTFRMPASTALYFDWDHAIMHMYVYIAADEESWRLYAADARAIIESAQYSADAWKAYGM